MYVRATPRETHGAPHNRSILMTPFLKSSGPDISGSRGRKRPLLSKAESRERRHDLTLEIRIFFRAAEMSRADDKKKKERTRGTKETFEPKTRVLRQQDERENDYGGEGGERKRNSDRSVIRLRTTETETLTGRTNGLDIFNIFNPHPCARARPPRSGSMRAGNPLSLRRTTTGVALRVFELRRRGLSTAAYI